MSNLEIPSHQPTQQKSEELFLLELAKRLDAQANASKVKEVEDPADWIEKYFYVDEPWDIETGKILPPGPIRLAEHQKRILREAIRRDENGMFIYTTILYSCPKKSGKTALAAAMLMYFVDQFCFMDRVYCIANDGKQAKDRMFGAIRKCLALHQKLDGPLGGIQVNKLEIMWPNGTVIEAIPVDPSGEAGSEPRASFWSELWGFSSAIQHKERLWTELTIPPTKWGRAIRWVESYAGFENESRVLENLYRLGVLEGTPHPDFPDLPITTNPQAGMLCYWDEKPRMVWQTKEYYQQERNILEPQEYNRIHRNQWQTAINALIQEPWWAACADSDIPALSRSLLAHYCQFCHTTYDWEAYHGRAWICDNCNGHLTVKTVVKRNHDTPVVISIDAATEGDCTSIEALTRHPLFPDTHVALRAARTAYAPVDLTIFAEHTIREWVNAWNVVVVVYDAFQMAKMAQDLTREGVVWFNRYSQGDRRAIGDKKLLDMIRDRKVRYNPGMENGVPVCEGLEEVTKHLLNAGVKRTGENRMRIVKTQGSNKHVDAAVALSMGVDETLRLLID